MRITTNSLIRNYKSGLGKALVNMTGAMDHVMTHRSFNSVAENPAAAARSSQLRRKYLQNEDHLSLLKDVQGRQDSQEDALMQIYSASSKIAENYSVQVLNGTNGKDARSTFASAIREFQQSMVLSLNTSYEDTFLFSGADGKNPPFKISSDGKTLTYRGIDVNTQDPAQLAKLKEMTKENQYVDLGFGLSLTKNQNTSISSVVSSSAFDISLPGINAIGYGMDDKGMSNNLISLAGQMAEVLEADAFDSEKYGQLMTKFKGVSDKVLRNVTELGVKSEFLEATKSRLTDTNISLQEQITSVEGVDMADAITNFTWAQYAYNAALKVGTNVLSPSFIDFMK